MIKIALFTIVFLALPSSVFAESSANVEINNQISASSNSSSTSTCKTSITTETNGKVTHYESDKCGNVSAKTENGETEIKENGVVVSGSNSNNPTKEPTVSSTAKPTEKPDDDEESKEANKNIFNAVENLLKKIFSIFD